MHFMFLDTFFVFVHGFKIIKNFFDAYVSTEIEMLQHYNYFKRKC